jgi:clan AA aspartic protease (TIGR02281 family)
MFKVLFCLVLFFGSACSFADVIYVDGRIGKSPCRFIVDTGADVVSIPYREALRMGIPVFSGQRVETMTASGKVGAYRLFLPSVTVGNVTVPNVLAQVMLNDGGQQTALLGMSFLGRVNFSLYNGQFRIFGGGNSSPPVTTVSPSYIPPVVVSQQQQQQYSQPLNRNICFKIMQELKEIRVLRDNQMDTGDSKSLLDIERDWQDKYRSYGCSVWQSQFDR